MFMWRHIKPQGMWNRHKQRWSRPLPGHTEGNRHAGLFICSSKEKSYWKIWHTYDFHLSEEVKTIIKGKQKPTHFRNGKLNHQLPGNCWTLGCVHRTANVIARTLSTSILEKWIVHLEGIDSFLENLSLSALICAILRERQSSYYLSDIQDLYVFSLCQIPSEHRFRYESSSFFFLCLSATGFYTSWAFSTLLTSLLLMFEHNQLLNRSHFPQQLCQSAAYSQLLLNMHLAPRRTPQGYWTGASCHLSATKHRSKFYGGRQWVMWRFRLCSHFSIRRALQARKISGVYSL